MNYTNPHLAGSKPLSIGALEDSACPPQAFSFSTLQNFESPESGAAAGKKGGQLFSLEER